MKMSNLEVVEKIFDKHTKMSESVLGNVMSATTSSMFEISVKKLCSTSSRSIVVHDKRHRQLFDDVFLT